MTDLAILGFNSIVGALGDARGMSQCEMQEVLYRRALAAKNSIGGPWDLLELQGYNSIRSIQRAPDFSTLDARFTDFKRRLNAALAKRGLA